MPLTNDEIRNIIKEFGESLNIKNFNDNAEYFENRSQVLNGLEHRLKFIPRKDSEDFKTSFIIT